MKNKSSLILVICLFFVSAIAYGTEMTGRQIMAEEESRYNAATESFIITMTVHNGLDPEKRPYRTIEMYMWLRNQNSLQSSLIKVASPASLRGMGVLTVQESVNQTLQTLYIPEIGTRTIASNKKSDRFMGVSDITFGDLEPEVLERWNYTRLPDQVLDGQTCFVLEAVPVNQADIRNYGYQKRVIWLSQSNYFILKTEYYDQEGQLAKIQLNQAIVQVNGFWRADRIVVQNLSRDHLTVLTFSERKINPQLDEDFFSERYLKRDIQAILRSLE